MRARKIALWTGAALAPLVSRVSAATITIPTISGNLSSLFEFIVGIVNELPSLVFAMIGVIVGIVAILIVTKTGHFVTKLFDKILGAIKIG